MKNSIKITLLAVGIILFSTSCSKTKDDICDINIICYTEAPDDLYVKLELSTNPSSTPIEVRFYIGNMDNGELYDKFHTTNNVEYYLMPINERYTATAKYLVEGDTVMVIDSDRLSRESYKNCEETCYDWEDEIILNLKLKK
ncbi:MAG TPA: hypothetical protein VFD77_09145 [Brumimicrobium sp.]|nr:hypothetical protein [Brumimicrobium sp.]